MGRFQVDWSVGVFNTPLRSSNREAGSSVSRSTHVDFSWSFDVFFRTNSINNYRYLGWKGSTFTHLQ